MKRWEEIFSHSWEEFRYAHVREYERDRLREVQYVVVVTEVRALQAILKQAGVGQEIELHYPPAKEDIKPTPDELAALPQRLSHLPTDFNRTRVRWH